MKLKKETKTHQTMATNKINLSFSYFYIESLLFFITILIGILGAVRIKNTLGLSLQQIPQVSFWKFIVYFTVTLILIFLVFYFLKGKTKTAILQALFVFSVFLGGIILINIWIPFIASFILMAALVVWWVKQPSVINQNINVVLGISGAGIILGLEVTPLTVVALLVVFSIYDYIAVYKTKHMVKMAEEMVNAHAVLGIIVPPNLKGFQTGLQKVKPRGVNLILGAGDIIFPLMFAVSLVKTSILQALIVAVFSLFGLLALFLIFRTRKVRQAMPALPFISAFAILGYFLVLLI